MAARSDSPPLLVGRGAVSDASSPSITQPRHMSSVSIIESGASDVKEPDSVDNQEKPLLEAGKSRKKIMFCCLPLEQFSIGGY